MHKIPALVVACGLWSLATVHAQLVHHYNMSDGTDSVSGDNGTLSGAATFTNGMLVTSGNTADDYLGLPASVGAGITGDFSIQDFTSTTVAESSYSTLFSFATQQTDNNFLLFNAYRPNTTGTSANFSQGTLAAGEKNIVTGSPLLADGAEHDLLLTYTAATGDVAIYNNGVLAGTGNIGPGFRFDLAAAGPFNGINGHAPFTGDRTYAGSTDDFRIYAQALTDAQAAALDAAGVNATDAQISSAIPEPSTWMAMFVGIGALLGLQRFRRSAA